MRVIILSLVVVIPLIFAAGAAIGYRSGLRRTQMLNLRSLGLSASTINRYRDAMHLISGMVEASDLDGQWSGNVLTAATETEARRIIAGTDEKWE